MDTEVLYEAETDTCTTAGYVADRKDRADGTDGRNALRCKGAGDYNRSYDGRYEGNGGRFEDGGLQPSFIWRGKACQNPEKLYGKPAASYSADVYV